MNLFRQDSLRKNEIAVCDLDLQEPVVIDEFKKHKTLGELILIDRISNMTSACGVVEDAAVDESKDLKAAFVYGSLKGNGDIFEEFYYNLESMTIAKVRPVQKTYTIGDEIPVSGESYQYPDDFDIVILRERIFVQVRGRKVEKDCTAGRIPVQQCSGYQWKRLCRCHYICTGCTGILRRAGCSR